MSVLYVLLPLALFGATIWTATFLWCVRNGQMDDLEGSAWRILGDDESRAQIAPVGSVDAKIARRSIHGFTK